MRSLILVTLLSLWCLGVKAQQDTTKQKEEYCLLSAEPRFLNANKVNFEIFLGEEPSVLRYSEVEIKDQRDTIKKFHTIPDGLNYLAKQGWSLASSYVINIKGDVIYHYIFRRRIAISK